MKRLAAIVAMLALAGLCVAWVQPGTPLHVAGWLAVLDAAAVPQFRVTFLTGTFPTNIVLHADYAGPATAANALYDSGDGVWHEYTSKTIPVTGDYVAFRGDWRTAAGTYNSMFRSTFQSAAYTARMSGQLTQKPSTNASAYLALFRDCTAITEIQDNPMPLLTGAPGASMFQATCYNMTGVTGALPSGFMDTRGLTGAPAANMFNTSCYGMSGVTGALPEGFMDTSGLTGAPAANMFNYACSGMSKVTSLPEGFMNTSGLTGAPAERMFSYALYMNPVSSSLKSLPEGFLDTRGLTGAPAVNMFLYSMLGLTGVTHLPDGICDMSQMTGTINGLNSTFRLMSSVTNAYVFHISSNVTITAANVGTSGESGPLASTWRGMTKWPGTVMWGTNVLFESFAPSNRIYTISGSTNVPGYADFDANWK